MKAYKCVLSIIGAIVVIAAAAAAVVVFKDQLVDFFTGVKNKACCCKNKVINDEYSDFADV